LQRSRERYALKEVRALSTAAEPDAQLAGRAITDALQRRPSPEAQQWITRIEHLRGTLRNDHSAVHITDFGAGGPESRRSDEEMYRGVAETTTVAAMSHSSKPPLEASILFHLIRAFGSRSAIELGTCLGVSAAYQAAAQQLNGGGKLITLEGSESLAKRSEENLQQLGLVNVKVVAGRFQDNLQQVLETARPVDYVFIDGHHDEQATINYYHSILPYLADRALVIFDDIHWSSGMTAAWNTITQHAAIKIAIDFKTIGICVVSKAIHTQHSYRI